jgi:hypothetical protein
LGWIGGEMSLLNYKCRISKKVSYRESLARNMAGKTVYILPETKKYIPELDTYRYDVLSEDTPLKEVSSICSRFLEPLTPSAEKILQ